jgi:hypothetical protein
MNLQDPTQLQQAVHDLLCGQLDEANRLDLLEKFAHDEQARRELAEALETYRLCAEAIGLGASESRVAEGMRSAQAMLRHAPDSPGRRFRLLPHRRNLPALAAIVVIGLCVYMAILVSKGPLVVQQVVQPAPLAQPASLSDTDLRAYRQIWQQVVSRGERGQSWLLLSDGTGQFGRLDQSGGTGLVALRCLLINAEGRLLGSSCVLLPSQAQITLSLPEIASLGEEIQCQVTTGGQRAGMALTTYQDSRQIAGLQGEVPVGSRPTEIGQFKVKGQNVRVVLQATPVEES